MKNNVKNECTLHFATFLAVQTVGEEKKNKEHKVHKKYLVNNSGLSRTNQQKFGFEEIQKTEVLKTRSKQP